MLSLYCLKWLNYLIMIYFNDSPPSKLHNKCYIPKYINIYFPFTQSVEYGLLYKYFLFTRVMHGLFDLNKVYYSTNHLA